jgi:N-acetylglutamate synthase
MSMRETPVDLAMVQNLSMVQACEERIINAWPAPSTLIIADYAVRFANGYSGRANSASPLRPNAALSTDEIGLVEQLYVEAGLPPCFRITPLMAEETAQQIRQRGYRMKDETIGMIAPLEGLVVPHDPALEIAPAATPQWISAICTHQVAEKRHEGNLRLIVGNVRLPAAFATIREGGASAAMGMGVAERGMAEIGAIMVDATQRGKGHGRRLVQGLMGWAAAQGCHSACLQVESGNAVAIRLYASLGFGPLYGYQTWIRD